MTSNTNNHSDSQERVEDFLTWVMANRDVSARRWTDEIEPELLNQMQRIIESEKAAQRKAILAKFPKKEDLSNGLPNEADGFNQARDLCVQAVNEAGTLTKEEEK